MGKVCRAVVSGGEHTFCSALVATAHFDALERGGRSGGGERRHARREGERGARRERDEEQQGAQRRH